LSFDSERAVSIWARKSLEQLRDEAMAHADASVLPRSLGRFALTCFGVGSTIGAGIFVLTGTVAAQHAGPAVALSFALASLVCLLAGLCYAELASMLPVAGSAYSYAYATLGEGVAWLVGWCLVLEYLFSCALVAIGWSSYVQSGLRDLGFELPALLRAAPFTIDRTHGLIATGALVDLPAVLIIALCTSVLLGGLRSSAAINSIIVIGKVAVIIAITVAAAGHVDPANWHPFVPPNAGTFGVYGWSGVMQGTAILFFAYIGFDAVSTLGQEARDPQRTIPASLIASLAICAVLYIAVSLTVTGLVSYRELNVPDPIYRALSAAGGSLVWAKSLVGCIAVFGLISVVFATLIGQSRIFYAMGRDGLLPAAFARVHRRTGAPYVGTLVTAGIAVFAAGCLPLALLGELISIGTLLAFGVVCVGVVVLRIVRPDTPRPFRAPWVPFTPIAGATACAYLMWTLPSATWIRLILWLAIGCLLYGLYGRRHSRLRQIDQPAHAIAPDRA
jgi:basic amino acid/polyamine antiporter, APA family